MRSPHPTGHAGIERNQPEAALPYARSSVRLDPKVPELERCMPDPCSGWPTHRFDPPLEHGHRGPSGGFQLVGRVARSRGPVPRLRALATALAQFEIPSSEVYERIGWCSFKLGDYSPAKQRMSKPRPGSQLHPSLEWLGILALNRWLEQTDKAVLIGRRPSKLSATVSDLILINPNSPA